MCPRTLGLFAVILVAVTLPIPAGAATSPVSTRVTDQSESYLSGLAANGSFTGSVLVAQGQHILFQKGYGRANGATGRLNSAGTVFRIGSVTKEFTATAIMQLQEAGKLSTSDHLCSYVANCPAAWQPITLHELLTHTAGLRRDCGKAGAATPAEVVTGCEKASLLFAPGTGFSYSNSGYIVLGTIVEKVSGQPYGQYLQQHIFGPLHMTHTGVGPLDPALPDSAAGYHNGRAANPAGDLFFSAGGVYSTVGDLYQWDRAFQTAAILSDASRQEMFTPAHANYAYGWVVTTRFGHSVVFHNGLVPGFHAMNIWFPHDGPIVVVLSNDQEAKVEAFGFHLAQLAVSGQEPTASSRASQGV